MKVKDRIIKIIRYSNFKTSRDMEFINKTMIH